jgi:hypothetical protein
MVTIDARPYGKSAPHALATVRTDAKGMWTFRAKPGIQTSYQAHASGATSSKLTIGVAPAVSVSELANGRVRAVVNGESRFNRRFVQLQVRNSDGSWKTIDRRRLSTASIAVFSATLPNSTIRIAMSINQAGAGYLGAASHALAYHAVGLTLDVSTHKVLFGHRVTLNGTLVNSHPGEHVSIVARPYGHSPFVLAVVTVDQHGMFSVNARPTVRTTYQAKFGGTRQSVVAPVGVAPRITVRELANGRLQAHVATGRSMAGREVQLQRLMPGNTWQTVAKRPLQATSTTTFALRVLPASTVRIAMSVNQAGAGYLGSTSHSLLYRAV